MSLPRLSLCTAAVLLALSTLNAQSVTTTPVGAVTANVNANSDQRLGVTLLRPAVYSGALTSVPNTTISQSAQVPSLVDAIYFVRFTTGTAAGQWFQITASTANSITTSENLESLGLGIGDKFEIRPFWTLATLFPQGGGLPKTSDVFSPKGFVILNDSQAVGVNLAASGFYFYHDGTQGPAGWYNNSNFSAADNVLISPEASLILRNITANTAGVTTLGDVPVAKVANTVVARAAGAQDNQIFNPYPAPLTLSASDLVTSGAIRPSANVFNPTDLLLVYSSSNTGLNAAASATYFYHDGSQGPAGWYDNSNFAAADAVTIPPGGAITIRKGAGAAQVAEWTPSLPYTL